jgi:SAM-dependent methyltransferase
MSGCPVCGDLAPHTLRRIVRTPRLTVRRCQRCGLHLADPVAPPAGEAGDYYAALPLAEYIAYYGPLRRRVFAENWRWIVARRPTGLALDVGASFGWFLQAAPPGWQVRGLEPAAEVAALARAAGLDVRPGGIEALATDPQQYDLITFWNVFEHLSDPQGALAVVREHLRPGGLLALAVPNRQGLLNRLAYLAYFLSRGRITGPLHTLFQVENPAPHRFHYTAGDLQRLLAAAGFAVLAVVGQPIVDLRRLALRAKLEPDGGGLASHPLGRALLTLAVGASWLLRLPDEIALYAQLRSSPPPAPSEAPATPGRAESAGAFGASGWMSASLLHQSATIAARCLTG